MPMPVLVSQNAIAAGLEAETPSGVEAEPAELTAFRA